MSFLPEDSGAKPDKVAASPFIPPSQLKDSMSTAAPELATIFDLEPLDRDLFRGRSPQTGWKRVFGGQVIGQALVAACRTVEDVAVRPPHSLHAYVLLPGDPSVPIIYDVEHLRDGNSFTTRHVRARQHGQAIFSMGVSFHVAEPGLSHQATMPTVPDPDELSGDPQGLPVPMRSYLARERPIELRPVEFDRYFGKKCPEGRFNIWIRVKQPLPDEPAIHQCALAYASDLLLINTVLMLHGRSVMEKSIMAASLDHAMWFHRPFRADEWLLYVQESPNAAGAIGIARGLVFSRAGVLVASVTQEGLVRERSEAVRR